jgi:enamine deaminase RidA (YjgF/YER057c/UK114 family)
LSGKGPLDPPTNEPIFGSFAEQVRQTFDNVGAILATAGLGLERSAKPTDYLSDFTWVTEFNEFYTVHIPEQRSAPMLVQAGLRQIDVEMDIITVDPSQMQSVIPKQYLHQCHQAWWSAATSAASLPIPYAGKRQALKI